MIKTFKGFLYFFLVLILLQKFVSAVTQEKLNDGKKLYIEKCVLCHGENGEGWDWSKKMVKPPVPIPNLRNILANRTDEYLETIILRGGTAVGLTDFMPALGFNLTEKDLSNLILYLRSLDSKTNSGSIFFEKWKLFHERNLVWALENFNQSTNQYSSIIFTSAAANLLAT